MFGLLGPKKGASYLDHVVFSLEEPEEIAVWIDRELLVEYPLAQFKVDAFVPHVVGDKQLVAQDDNGGHKTAEASLFIVNSSQITYPRILS